MPLFGSKHHNNSAGVDPITGRGNATGGVGGVNPNAPSSGVTDPNYNNNTSTGHNVLHRNQPDTMTNSTAPHSGGVGLGHNNNNANPLHHNQNAGVGGVNDPAYNSTTGDGRFHGHNAAAEANHVAQARDGTNHGGVGTGAGTGTGTGVGTGIGTGAGVDHGTGVGTGVHGGHANASQARSEERKGKIQHAVGTLLSSESMKAKGLAKEQEANALRNQARELDNATALEEQARLARERAVGHGAHPGHATLGGPQAGAGAGAGPGVTGQSGGVY